MKSKVRFQPSNKQRQAIAEYLESHSTKPLIRVQYLFVVAMHEVFGLGKDRMRRFFARYDELINEYNIWQMDDVCDEQLDRAVKQIMGDDFETGLLK